MYDFLIYRHSHALANLVVQPRSFTNIPGSSFADANKNSTSSSLTAPWGEKSIWAFNGAPKRDVKPEASKLQDYKSQGTVKQPSTEKKSGSGMLLEGSQAWGLRTDSNNRSFY